MKKLKWKVQDRKLQLLTKLYVNLVNESIKKIYLLLKWLHPLERIALEYPSNIWSNKKSYSARSWTNKRKEKMHLNDFGTNIGKVNNWNMKPS